MTMDESEFNQKVDELLAAIEDTIDEVIEDKDLEIDFETAGGILTLQFEDDSKIIINRQTPLRQIWVATRSGGFHFDFEPEKDQWREEKTGAELFAELSRYCSTSSGANVVLEA